MFNPSKVMATFGRISIGKEDIELPDVETMKKDVAEAQRLIDDPEADPEWDRKWVLINGEYFELYSVGGFPQWPKKYLETT